MAKGGWPRLQWARSQVDSAGVDCLVSCIKREADDLTCCTKGKRIDFSRVAAQDRIGFTEFDSGCCRRQEQGEQHQSRDFVYFHIFTFFD